MRPTAATPSSKTRYSLTNDGPVLLITYASVSNSLLLTAAVLKTTRPVRPPTLRKAARSTLSDAVWRAGTKAQQVAAVAAAEAAAGEAGAAVPAIRLLTMLPLLLPPPPPPPRLLRRTGRGSGTAAEWATRGRRSPATGAGEGTLICRALWTPGFHLLCHVTVL